MIRKEFEERLARLGPGPIGSDLAPQVLYLRKKVNILMNYILQHEIAPRKSNVKEQEAIEGKKDDPEKTP